MLKGCQNSLAVQEYSQETADQMLEIKTAHQPQLRAAFKRRIKTPCTPLVNITCRAAAGQGEGYQSPSTWKMLPFLPGCSKRLVWHCEKALRARDGNHMRVNPPGKSPMCKAAGRPPTNYMCQVLTGCLACLGTEQDRGQRGSHPLERAWHVTCVFSAREESHSRECVGEAA